MGGRVCSVAGEQNHIAGLDFPGEAHEEARVDGEGGGHTRVYLFGGLVGVHEAGNHEAPVGCGSPEVHGAGSNGRVHKGN